MCSGVCCDVDRRRVCIEWPEVGYGCIESSNRHCAAIHLHPQGKRRKKKNRTPPRALRLLACGGHGLWRRFGKKMDDTAIYDRCPTGRRFYRALGDEHTNTLPCFWRSKCRNNVPCLLCCTGQRYARICALLPSIDSSKGHRAAVDRQD